MSRLAVGDVDRVSELSRELDTLRIGAGPALTFLVPQLQQLLDAELAVAHSVERDGKGYGLSFMETAGPTVPRMKSVFGEWLKGQTGRWSGFNALRPEPSQRNVALSLGQIFRLVRTSTFPVQEEIFPRLGLDRCDQLRALICDGPSLLAWVGGYRRDVFTGRERTLLAWLIPALRKRLTLERQLEQCDVASAGLAAALEAISTAALVLGPRGSVEHANSAGLALLQTEARASEWLQPRAREPGADRFSRTGLAVRGAGEHQLAVLKPRATDPTHRLNSAVSRWNLTTKEAEVLRWLARGAANKTIAAALGCEEATVEFHVTGLLVKAQADSRAKLVAKLWLLS